MTKSPSWQALEAMANSKDLPSLRALFETDAERAERYGIEAAGLYLDYSKNRITPPIMAELLALARDADLEGSRKGMFAGERINVTEGRAVLHAALRDFSHRAYYVDEENVTTSIERVRRQMQDFCNRVHRGEWLGTTGKPLTTVVNIGIGGSDLGPAMVCEALRPYTLAGRRSYFVSNVDGQHLHDVLQEIDPQTTLFVIASKTFTTQETMANAQSARAWFLSAMQARGDSSPALAKHFVALSTNERAVREFGVDPENMFGFWDWVGGRYSLWSAIGLSIALQVGFDLFEDLLRGAHAMDEHFRDAPLAENMPVILALVGIWNRNFLQCTAHAVLPYDQHLSRLPAYLQQADMESNGKSRSITGQRVDYHTGPVIFGEPGTNGQHAFYQLIHQGTDIISCDFIAAVHSHAPLSGHHEKLLANFVAQMEALMCGRSKEEVRDELEAQGYSDSEITDLAPHKIFEGGRPSNAILMERLTPQTLGALIALYEHKIFCQGVIWQINSFDQWGVELGKQLAKVILGEIEDPAIPLKSHDASTAGLIGRIRKHRTRDSMHATDGSVELADD